MADRSHGFSYLKAHAAHGVGGVNTVGVPRQISQFRLGPAKGRLPQTYHLILPCGARKAVKERAWRDDCEILSLNLGCGQSGSAGMSGDGK
jgi:hypothetical protein